jgi:small multidrug resistance pump
MKPLFGYLFLALGISCGIASNSFAKVSEGFSKLYTFSLMYSI